MTIRLPDIPVLAVVGHKASQTVCQVLRAIPVGYSSWLYVAAQVAAPNKIHSCLADGLVPLALPAASPGGKVAAASGALPAQMQSPPSGVRA